MEDTKVICVGELLIDMFCTDRDITLKKGTNFKKMPGGAPANVAVTIAKLGGNSLFFGQVGNDPFGEFLIETLKEYKVNTSMIIRDESTPTTMAFVSLTSNGERDFHFLRGADKQLELQSIDVDMYLSNRSIFHFGSATALLDGPLKSTYFELLRKAHKNHSFISFDPNFRHDLWPDNKEEFVNLSHKIISYSDLVKVSEEELILLTNNEDIPEGVKKIHDLGANIVLVTLGEDGSFLSYDKRTALIPSREITTVDTTGAGDAFIGAVLYQLAEDIDNPSYLEFSRLRDIVQFANNVGADVCTKIGSLTAIPTRDQLT